MVFMLNSIEKKANLWQVETDNPVSSPTPPLAKIVPGVKWERGILLHSFLHDSFHVVSNLENTCQQGLPDVWQGVIPSSDDVLDTSCISPHLVPAPYIIGKPLVPIAAKVLT